MVSAIQLSTAFFIATFSPWAAPPNDITPTTATTINRFIRTPCAFSHPEYAEVSCDQSAASDEIFPLLPFLFVKTS
jgi:hypothetical protein